MKTHKAIQVDVLDILEHNLKTQVYTDKVRTVAFSLYEESIHLLFYELICPLRNVLKESNGDIED